MKTKILDTFRCADHTILYKDLHIDRIVNSFNFFHCLVDVKKILKLYDQIEMETKGDLRIRIEFSIESDFKIEKQQTEFKPILKPIQLVPALFGKQPAGEGLGNLKTTDREYWDKNLRTLDSSNVEKDVLGINEHGFVTETSRFSLFLFDEKQFYTPPLESGCLRGVFREHCFMDDGVDFKGRKFPIEERDFMLDDLAGYQLFVGNSVQGFLPAKIDV